MQVFPSLRKGAFLPFLPYFLAIAAMVCLSPYALLWCWFLPCRALVAYCITFFTSQMPYRCVIVKMHPSVDSSFLKKSKKKSPFFTLLKANMLIHGLCFLAQCKNHKSCQNTNEIIAFFFNMHICMDASKGKKMSVSFFHTAFLLSSLRSKWWCVSIRMDCLVVLSAITCSSNYYHAYCIIVSCFLPVYDCRYVVLIDFRKLKKKKKCN